MRDEEPTRPGLRITRVYTRIGDAGTTRLVGGQVVAKNDPRLEAYGTGDELQSTIALARDALGAVQAESGERFPPALGLIAQHLVHIQNLLFTFNGDLATRVEDRWADMPLIAQADVEYLEQLVDACNEPLPPLKDFILPGGHPAVTALHLCRVVCRRAERTLETLAQAEPVGEFARPFLNRLSDAFFVLGRRVSHELERMGLMRGETIWRRDLPPPPMPNA